ncbi:hypothetical protein CDAR_51601 [Caerostris darwini]|uniref:Uncharacterized protein n=1 Tax=Caerostris darwini TaxID=1538125 RepID=A0AAV4VU40_9ARAC|nr:hypothetical protein CDAR_51601 [Caerostris darwini]
MERGESNELLNELENTKDSFAPTRQRNPIILRSVHISTLFLLSNPSCAAGNPSDHHEMPVSGPSDDHLTLADVFAFAFHNRCRPLTGLLTA